MFSKRGFSNYCMFFILTILVFPSLSLNIGDDCNSSKECNSGIEKHAICLKKPSDPTIGECACNRGYTQDEFGVSCERIIDKGCDDVTDCIFNEEDQNGVCSNVDNKCHCPTGSFLHPLLSICVSKQTFVNAACSSNNDCDQIPNAICNPTRKICVCNEATSFLASKSGNCFALPSSLNHPCDFDDQCKASNDIPQNMCCSEASSSTNTWGTCKCCTGYVENQNQCKPPCTLNTQCSSGEYCELNGGFCQTMKTFNSVCNATFECAGYETRNIVCVDRNGVQRCHCALGFVPDRPTTDINMICIELPPVENIQPCSATDLYGVQWVANPGETRVLPCPGRLTGVATWHCQPDGRFEGTQPNFDNCTTPWVNEINDTLSDIIDTETGTIDVVNATDLMTNIEQLLDAAYMSDGDDSDSSENQFYGHEIQNMVSIVDVIVNNMVFMEDGNQDVNVVYEEATEEALKIVEKLLRFNKPWEQLPTANRTIVFSNVLHLIETSAFQLASRINDSDAEVNEYIKSYSQRGFKVTSGISNSVNLVYPIDSEKRRGKDSFIELPSNWQTASGSRQSMVGSAFVGMSVDIDYSRRNIPSRIFNAEDLTVGTSRSLNSELLGFSMSQKQEDIKLRDGETAKITFYHDSDSWGTKSKAMARKLHDGEKPRAAGGTVQCVRLDEAKKIWTTEGCFLIETGPYSTTCACDHTGKYGLQTEFHKYPGKTTQLQAVSLTGFGLSTALQCLKVYKSKAKDLRENIKTLMMLFLITSNLLLVGFVDRHYFYISDGWCYFVGVLSHFIGLCGLMCLATAGVHIYMFPNEVKKGVVQTNTEGVSANNDAKKPKWVAYKKWIYSTTIIGIPILITLVTIIVGAISGDNTRVYGGDFCWLDGPYIWAFFGPAISTVIICVLFYVGLHFWIQSILEKITDVNEKNTMEKAEDIMKKNVLLAILLGITWALGFYQLGPHYSDSEVVQYTFPIFTGLQGVLLTFLEMEKGIGDSFKSFIELKSKNKTNEDENTKKNVSFSNSRTHNSDSNSNDEAIKSSVPKSRNKTRSGVKNDSRGKQPVVPRRTHSSIDSEITDVNRSRHASYTLDDEQPTTSSHHPPQNPMPKNVKTEESPTLGNNVGTYGTKNNRDLTYDSSDDDESVESFSPSEAPSVSLTSFTRL